MALFTSQFASTPHSTSPLVPLVPRTFHLVARNSLQIVATLKHTDAIFNCRSAHTDTGSTSDATQNHRLGFSNIASHVLPSLFLDDAPVQDNKEEEPMFTLLAELRLLVNEAVYKGEMHSILAQRRENWNKLFQNTLTVATMSVFDLLIDLNKQHPSLTVSISAIVLDMGCAFVMTTDPRSQLADQETTASRLLKNIANNIDCTLQTPSDLRQHASALLKDSKRRLQALDRAASAMPSTSGGLENFSTQAIRPPLLRNSASTTQMPASTEANGSILESITGDSKETSAVVKVNKCLAIAAPVFAVSGAALNAVDALGWSNEHLGLFAAICRVLAGVAGSVSQDMQLGMVFELYRNSSGYNAEVETSIERTVQRPLHQRQDEVWFNRKADCAIEGIGKEDDELP